MELELARRIIHAGEEHATSIDARMTIAVADTGGHLVALARMDGTAFMTTEVATAKAFTAASTGAPGAQLQAVVGGYPTLVAAAASLFHGRFLPALGSIPVYVDGTLVGGVGASGGSPEQDDAVAQAAAAGAAG